MKEESWWARATALATAAVLCIVLLPVLVLATPFLAVRAWSAGRRRRRLQREFHHRWGGQGKRLLLVYSRSPHWQAYIEQHWLPALASIAVVLDWSERNAWGERHALEADVFRAWAGDREFNPLAIVIPPEGPVRVIRFWRAFRDYKRGREHNLRAAEAELEAATGVRLRAGA